MIETRVPKDIRAYETKIIGPLTARNAISVATAIVFDVILYKTIIKPFNISSNILMYILIIVDLPILAFGFLKIQGVPFEKYIRSFIGSVFIAPSKRKAKNTIIEKEKIRPLTSKEKREIEQKNAKYMKKNKIIVSQ